MRDFVAFLVIISTQKHFMTPTTVEEPPIETRIELLKREIFDELQEKHNIKHSHNVFSDRFSDMYEYVNDDNKPITPIMSYDKRKLKGRYKMPEIISPPTEKYVPSDTSVGGVDDGKPIPNLRHKPIKQKARLSKPKEVFYRKMFFDDDERNKPQKWTHCLDLITPLLTGIKTNITYTKIISANDPVILRLAHLLKLDVSKMNTDEIRSVLYQISNLQLRLFQWDINAIKTIFNVIITRPPHNFSSLKKGLKEIFARWKLDTSDTVSFLKQSRIFRPPCVQVSNFSGSTLTPNFVRYSKSKPTKCAVEDGSDCSGGG